MRKTTNLSSAIICFLATSNSVVAGDLEISASVAATSDYVWRGLTQTDNGPAIQGAFDFDYTLFETEGVLKTLVYFSVRGHLISITPYSVGVTPWKSISTAVYPVPSTSEWTLAGL